MRKIITFIFCSIIFSATAQVSQKAKTIIFENGKRVRAFQLPTKMVCAFKDGRVQQLILENIINDTLIFKKYYNQQNFDCTLNSILRIDVNNTDRNIKKAKFITSIAATLTFATLTVAGILKYNPHYEEGDFSLLFALFLGLPATIISSVSVIANTDALPFIFETNKWKVYVK